MSDEVLKLIPLSPTYVPDNEILKTAVARVREYFPKAERIEMEISESPQFIDPGSNLERITCPICNAVLEDGWWQDAMDKASENGFRDLAVELPCCGQKTTLNDLRYQWPAGFAQFSIEIHNPEAEDPEAVLPDLADFLGSPLRIIRAHY
ncbi:hypothetical protein LARV_00583 [Longilinea arvoryzae]|uniref:Uncharacterized protein n=1 Tax=Longilinea arvoryzae TaxID=360412 RepID=A0A0S7BGC7_9CHLR|nr:hypothetical protein [Longilinea arvoryzae]GAP12843.1 hypothetical protein LARV_00583 [Longilinea arvoryzae]